MTVAPGLCATPTLASLNSERAPFKLPALAYPLSALAPTIDEQTMALHHGKHHKAYVDKLNSALAGPDLQISLVDILKSVKDRPAIVRNNAGGHWNHAFFWTVLAPQPATTKPSSALSRRLRKDFGSFEKFREAFEKAGLDIFGSGWVWLIVTPEGPLRISTTSNQDNPLMDIAPQQGRPILALDVWEHAYYLQYQNKRSDYVRAFWNIVNWDQVSRYFEEK
jgi:Fe-Mn family superoxide dismutase